MPQAAAFAETAIRKLSPALINQIAAGEVVARPASAFKELVENSLDAGASRIEASVEETARSFTVRDDGRGMNKADARLAIERYATSKIREFDDLARLKTRGFRGEALAAIASVSRFEMLTRRAEDEAGVRLRAEGGHNARVEAAGAPPGTTIHVRDLFFNTPAREKFLRTPVAEWGAILREFIRQALTRPDVGFSIRWRGKPYLALPAAQTLKERLAAALPGGAAAELIEFDSTLHEVRAWGAVTGPRATRRDRRHQFFFAAGRPIASRTLGFALQEAYRGLIMTGEFPLGAVFIELPGEEIDVNVHPTKEEVRFRNESLVAGAIHRAVLEALRAADIVPRLELRIPGAGARAQTAADSPAPPGFFSAPARVQLTEPAVDAPPLAAADTDKSSCTTATPRSESDKRRNAHPPAAAPSVPSYPDQTASEEASLIRRFRDSGAAPRVLGQLELTYILAAAPGQGLLLVDQHAAHEKVLYLQRRGRKGALEIQELLVPYTYESAPSERAALEALLPALAAEGFETDNFGGGTFIVRSVPVAWDRIDVGAFVRDLTDDLGRGDLARGIEDLRHRIAARAACRAAVMAGDPLTIPEMQRLLDQVLETEDALRCPHGRPTMTLLSKAQLDRQFGRMG